jgi:hypothetical protein
MTWDIHANVSSTETGSGAFRVSDDGNDLERHLVGELGERDGVQERLSALVAPARNLNAITQQEIVKEVSSKVHRVEEPKAIALRARVLLGTVDLAAVGLAVEHRAMRDPCACGAGNDPWIHGIDDPELRVAQLSPHAYKNSSRDPMRYWTWFTNTTRVLVPSIFSVIMRSSPARSASTWSVKRPLSP